MTSNMYRSILLVLTLYFKPSYANNSNKWSLYDRRVQLRDNSPTTLGGTTTFFAQALSCVGQRFRFCFTSEFGKSCGDVNSRFYNYSISNWKSSGKHKVSLTVERTKPNYTDCGQASIYAVITGLGHYFWNDFIRIMFPVTYLLRTLWCIKRFFNSHGNHVHNMFIMIKIIMTLLMMMRMTSIQM